MSSSDSQSIWVVENIFPPGQLHLIGGSRGVGKTAFEIWMESQVLQGRDFLGHRTNPPPWWGTVIFDRGPEDRLSWWEKAGMQPQPYYSLVDDAEMTPLRLAIMNEITVYEFIIDKIVKTLRPPRGGCLTIDVCNPLAGDSRNGYMSGFARGWALSKFAKDMGLTIFGIMHGSKQMSGAQYLRPTDRIIGGTGFLGTAGTICYVTSREETNRDGLHELHWEPHHHKAEAFYLRRTPIGLYERADEELPEVELIQTPDGALSRTASAIVHLVGDAGVPVPTKILVTRAEGGGIPRRTLFRILRQLEGAGLVSQQQRGQWTALPRGEHN